MSAVLPDQATLAHQLAQLLATDPGYAGLPWRSLAMVGEAAPGCLSMHGFLYLPDDRAVPAFPRNIQVFKQLKALATLMQRRDGRYWNACVVGIERASGQARFHFEYGDAGSWLITAQNASQMAEWLRLVA